MPQFTGSWQKKSDIERFSQALDHQCSLFGASAHSSRLNLLTLQGIYQHRRRSYGVYSATHAWLVAHGFDPFFFELVFPEQYHSGMSKAEWKLMKLWTSSQEAGSSFSFRRIVYIEPNDAIRQEVQEQWSGLSESPLDAYNGLTAFSSCIALREQRAIIAPLLELHRAELEREQVNASPEEVRVLLDDSDETIEEDIEEEDVQEEEIVRPRKQRAIKSSLPDDLLDEGQVAPRKKQAKGEKRVRQARRNLKAVAG